MEVDTRTPLDRLRSLRLVHLRVLVCFDRQVAADGGEEVDKRALLDRLQSNLTEAPPGSASSVDFMVQHNVSSMYNQSSTRLSSHGNSKVERVEIAAGQRFHRRLHGAAQRE